MKGLKRTGMWILMLGKRYLKNPILLLTIIAIPLMVFTLRFSTGRDEAAIRVALYASGSDALSAHTIEKMTDNSSTVISFYNVASEEEAYEEVENGEAVCAYIFPKDFEKMVELYVAGKRGRLPYKGHLIKCIQEEKTNYTKITGEMVFASFYKKFANEILLEFMKEERKDFSKTDWEIINEYYDEYHIDAEFFHFEYMDGSENKLIQEQAVSFLLLPVRGLILTLILLAAMTGGVVAYRDKERGMFRSITVERRGPLNYLYVLVPTVIVSVAGLMGIWLANVWTDFMRETVCMALYVFLVTGMCNLLRRICGNGIRFASIIPLYLMFNIVFCPVFLDISTMLSQIRYLQYDLPVNYGLSALYNNDIRSMMLVVGIVTLGTVRIGREKE